MSTDLPVDRLFPIQLAQPAFWLQLVRLGNRSQIECHLTESGDST
jgi:hypothetical protein